MRHLLNRQVLELKISSAVDAFTIQNKMSLHYWKHIIPMLNKIFDELPEQDGVVRIDEIEIDIGEIPMEYLDAVSWPSDFISQIENKLRTAIAAQIEKREHEIEATELDLFKQWLFYMQEGYLPWNAVEWRAEDQMEVLEVLATDFTSVSSLRRVIKQNVTALSRIVLQHDDGFLQKLVEILSAKPQQKLIPTLNEASELIQLMNEKQAFSKTNRPRVRELLWSLIISHASEHQSTNAQLVTRLIEKYFPFVAYAKIKLHDRARSLLLFQQIEQFYNTARQVKETKLSEEPGEKKMSTGESEEEKNKDERPTIEMDASEKGSISPASDIREIQKEDGPEIRGSKQLPDSDLPDTKKKTEMEDRERNERGQKKQTNTPLEYETQSSESGASEQLNDFAEFDEQLLKNETHDEKYDDMRAIDEQRTEEGIHVTSGGIILVHPFLQTLFRKLSWTENEAFRNAHCRHKALHLLHYIATGLLQPDEYSLTVPKLLCGYPFRMPVPKEIVLDDEELSEADNMIEAIIANWEVLKQTSPAGLREGFLQRNGRLTYRNEKIYLQLENKTMDALLDHLPWNIGIIKLPWMKHMMVVDWR